MPRLRLLATFLFFSMLQLTLPTPSTASPLPPNVMASRSANGRFLVLTQRELDSSDQNGGRRIIRTAYQVYESEPFSNTKDRLSAPVPFWSDSAFSWRLTLEGHEGRRVFWPMISDDGNTLVLVAVTVPMRGEPVLQIYRKQNHAGVLIRTLEISDLWTSSEIDPQPNSVVMFTDASPEWFSGGSLAFATDNQSLLYRTQWNDHLQIRLSDGSVSLLRP